MDELSAIVAAIEECEGQPVLATVVDVDGSSYRQPGARMLILPADDAENIGERRIGMISGGCLERELCKMADALTRFGPRLVTFDTRGNRLHPHGRFGSGCHGLLHILLERLDGAMHNAVAQMNLVVKAEKPLVVALVCRSEGSMPAVGTRFDEENLIPGVGSTGRTSGPLMSSIRESLKQFPDTRDPVMKRFVAGDDWCEVFFYCLEPAPPLWIFGAGDDAIPLIRLAETLGLRLTVFGQRAELLSADRIGVRVAFRALHPHQIIEQFEPSAETNVILMTHSLNDDAQLLPWALNSPARYVGILGPKQRTGRLLQMCLEKGVLITSRQFEKLRTPAGLDLGASNAAEIAVAILAEIIATRNERDGRPLLYRTEPIYGSSHHEVIELEASHRSNSPEVALGHQ